MHSLRAWVDNRPQFASIRGIVDTIDSSVGETQTTTQTTTATGKALFTEVATNHANGTKP